MTRADDASVERLRNEAPEMMEQLVEIQMKQIRVTGKVRCNSHAMLSSVAMEVQK